ncbi:MAG: YifB family Mg chelatase-like AAA ATPase [Alphaproteobacteria bacterium]|nr:YifB family Mg chelatase-like AAA ATPase [Alphaproteobacteria bacterium]MCB9929836.1 YifB family Mg chelatase-like AAA ATPase [Alphaproteobacteria bacterium]
MVAHIQTAAFNGVEVLPVDVQVHLARGAIPGFFVVGLPNKAVSESKERVRAALAAIGMAIPPTRVTVNLAPADVVKEGSHYDLPIALAVLVALGKVDASAAAQWLVLGELGLDGTLAPVAGVLPAAIHALSRNLGIVCPLANGGEAAWAGSVQAVAPRDLLELINHLNDDTTLTPPKAAALAAPPAAPDLRDVKGQETVKRALEIAAAGGHNLLMSGPPGSGKSMLAARLPGLLPPLTPAEALSVSMIHSVAGNLEGGRILRHPPYRDPHHSASVPALVGGGVGAKPGEVSLAHYGVLFLDELPEFTRPALEALRQPLEGGTVTVARANRHVTYPANVQLIAAMNPCRCGHIDDAGRACSRAPKCAADYQARISGPVFDRIDMVVEVPRVSTADLALPPAEDGTAEVAARVAEARAIQRERFRALAPDQHLRVNAEAEGGLLETIATPDAEGLALLQRAAERLQLSARAYHRTLRVARTIADLDRAESVRRPHIAEALSYRRRSG